MDEREGDVAVKRPAREPEATVESLPMLRACRDCRTRRKPRECARFAFQFIEMISFFLNLPHFVAVVFHVESPAALILRTSRGENVEIYSSGIRVANRHTPEAAAAPQSRSSDAVQYPAAYQRGAHRNRCMRMHAAGSSGKASSSRKAAVHALENIDDRVLDELVDVIRLFGQPERVHLGAEHVDRGADGLVRGRGGC